MLRYRSLSKHDRQKILRMVAEIAPVRAPEDMEPYLDALANYLQIKSVVADCQNRINSITNRPAKICVEYVVNGRVLLLPL